MMSLVSLELFPKYLVSETGEPAPFVKSLLYDPLPSRREVSY